VPITLSSTTLLVVGRQDADSVAPLG